MSNEPYVKRMHDFYYEIKDFLGGDSDRFKEFRRQVIETEA